MRNIPEIVGVDHGYRNMKTANVCFPSAIMEIASKPDILDDVLEFEGKYYTTACKNILAVDTHDKSKSKEFYLLTLVALAKELNTRSCSNTDISIRLATGLPKEWYLDQLKNFKTMLQQNSILNYYFEGKRYNFKLEEVSVYQQGYAACIAYIKKFQDKFFVVVDIGGETMDEIAIKKGKTDNPNCHIETKGTIWLYKYLANKVRTKLYKEIDESYIEYYINSGSKDKKPVNDYERILQEGLIEYADMVFDFLKEYKVNLDLTPVVFVGGGEIVIRNFGTYSEVMTHFVTDICSNAKGYEILEKSRFYHSRNN